MKTKFICIATILSLCASLHPAAAQGTAFTYQGRLNSNANPVNGNYDLTFSLYNAGTGGMPIGNILTIKVALHSGRPAPRTDVYRMVSVTAQGFKDVYLPLNFPFDERRVEDSFTMPDCQLVS